MSPPQCQDPALPISRVAGGSASVQSKHQRLHNSYDLRFYKEEYEPPLPSFSERTSSSHDTLPCLQEPSVSFKLHSHLFGPHFSRKGHQSEPQSRTQFRALSAGRWSTLNSFPVPIISQTSFLEQQEDLQNHQNLAGLEMNITQDPGRKEDFNPTGKHKGTAMKGLFKRCLQDQRDKWEF